MHTVGREPVVLSSYRSASSDELPLSGSLVTASCTGAAVRVERRSATMASYRGRILVNTGALIDDKKEGYGAML
jgi:hypothetical protein